MRRRTFMQTMSAVFSTTVAGLQIPAATLKAEKSPLDLAALKLEHFTDCHTVKRYDMTEPFEIEGETHASDGRLIVTIPTTLATENAATKPFPPVGRLWWDTFEKGGWAPLPAPSYSSPLIRELACPDCLGTGRQGEDVRRCTVCRANKAKWTTLPSGLEGCPHCDNGWVGGERCQGCKRSSDGDRNDKRWERVGERNKNSVDVIDGVRFQASFTEKFRRLSDGNVEYKILRNVEPSFESDPVVAVAALRLGLPGGYEARGFVMPLHEDAD